MRKPNRKPLLSSHLAGDICLIFFSSKKQISYHWSVDMASYSADSRDWVGGVKVEASLSGLVSRDGGTGSGKIKENQV